MATLNVGAMAARLGLDPSEFLEKMKGVQGFNGFVSSEMARQWKKTGRDGQEGIRLIDEALGIHVARPVARIIAETFPAFSKALSGLLGGIAFGALGYAVVEFGERINRKMDEAKKKQEEYDEAVRKSKTVYAESTLENERNIDKLQAKLAALKGDTHAEALFKIKEGAAQDVQTLAKQVDGLVEAERREIAADEARNNLWAAFGSIWHQVWTSDATLNIEAIDGQLKTFSEHFADLGRQRDPLKAMADQAKYLDDAIKQATADLALMTTPAKAEEFPQPDFANAETGILPNRQTASQEALESQKKYLDGLNKIKGLQDQILTIRKDQEAIDNREKAKQHAQELRAEIEARHRLAQSSIAAASAAELAAAATGKGTQASVLAAAAAEAEKKILDQRAAAQTKYYSGTNQKISADPHYQAGQAADEALIREAALREQVSKAFEEYNRAIADFNTKSAERSSALNTEGEAHGKVASEQAKELAGLIPLKERLDGLRAAYEALRGGAGTSAAPQPVIGPPTKDQAMLAQIAEATKAFQSAEATITLKINPQIQTAAFKAELAKVKDEINSLSGAEVSPLAKIDAQVLKLTRDLSLTPEQVSELRKALVDLQGVKIGGEFEKLARQIQEAQASTAALSTGSPFAKLDAEALKLGHEFGLDPQQVALLRQGLIELQAVENIGKAFEGVDQFNASGARMQQLRQQMDGLREASVTGKTSDGVHLSPDALEAVKLEMQQIQDEEDKLLVKTGGIDAGFKAWLDSLQRVESEGQTVFAALTQATKGFEDTAAGSLFKIIEAHRDQHQKLIHELRSMWEGYFAGLTKMALEHGMQKLLAPIGGLVGGIFNKQKAPALPPTAPGSSTGLGALIPKPGGGLTAAGTSLTNAANLLIAAAHALSASAASGGGAGLPIPGIGGGGGDSAFAGGGAAGVDAGAPIPFFAEGGDATPGSSFVSGEAGAERVDLDSRGGAHVTPLGFSQSGGDTHIHQDFRGAVVTDDLMRKAEAARMSAITEDRAVARAVSMSSETAKRSRPPVR